MNKILLNILIFVGFQQLILGANVNKDPEPKLGICLYCYTENECEHAIVESCTSETCKNKYGTCVKEVYSVCSKGHTMCEIVFMILLKMAYKTREEKLIVSVLICKKAWVAKILQNVKS